MNNEIVINEKMLALIRQSLRSLDASTEPEAVVPIMHMAPHFISRSSQVPENGLTRLYPLDIDGRTIHIYLRSHD